MKQQIRNLTPEELKQAVTELGQPAFRAKQLMDWIYKGKTSFREMHNLPEVLILALEDAYTLDPLTLMEE